MWPFKRKQNREITPPIDDVLLQTLLNRKTITKDEAMNIPAVASCVHLISETVSMIPIKLYEEKTINGKRKTVEIHNDDRPFLLNDDTKDTLDGVQFKRAIVRDYLLNGNAYAYINKNRNKFKSLNYVACNNISVLENFDPIFKDFNILVYGTKYKNPTRHANQEFATGPGNLEMASHYKPFEFLKILRSTEDGAKGKGIIEENNELLSVAYTTLKYEQNLVATGGNKKGFITAENKLSAEAMATLKRAWKNLYSNNEENVIVLNDGLTFKEASNTSVEMQLNENKDSTTKAIQRIFGIPPDSSYEAFIKTAVMPILVAIECALNRDFLLEKEKRSFFFAFDTKEITKGDIKTRFEAYKTALDSNLMQIDECRYMENLEPLGLNFIKLGLQDVLYNPETHEVYTPNTGQSTNITGSGGEKIEN